MDCAGEAQRGCRGEEEERGGGGGSIRASGVPDHHQHPPQLFPQLPASDAHWPLSAMTPQRENWSRHRSAKNTQGHARQRPSSSRQSVLSCQVCLGFTSQQLLVRTHGAHTDLLVDDVHSPHAATKWQDGWSFNERSASLGFVFSFLLTCLEVESQQLHLKSSSLKRRRF